MLNGHRDRIVPLKGQAAGQHLIEHNASGIDIRTGIDMAASGLLRGDVVHRADGLLRHSGLGSG